MSSASDRSLSNTASNFSNSTVTSSASTCCYLAFNLLLLVTAYYSLRAKFSANIFVCLLGVPTSSGISVSYFLIDTDSSLPIDLKESFLALFLSIYLGVSSVSVKGLDSLEDFLERGRDNFG